MKFKELDKKTDKAMTRLLSEKRGKLQELRFNLNIRGLKNHREIREVKRDIAKILTKLNQNNA